MNWRPRATAVQGRDLKISGAVDGEFDHLRPGDADAALHRRQRPGRPGSRSRRPAAWPKCCIRPSPIRTPAGCRCPTSASSRTCCATRHRPSSPGASGDDGVFEASELLLEVPDPLRGGGSAPVFRSVTLHRTIPRPGLDGLPLPPAGRSVLTAQPSIPFPRPRWEGCAPGSGFLCGGLPRAGQCRLLHARGDLRGGALRCGSGGLRRAAPPAGPDRQRPERDAAHLAPAERRLGLPDRLARSAATTTSSTSPRRPALAMPTYLKVTAWWGGQAGSLLFWSWLMAAFTTAASAAQLGARPRVPALGDRRDHGHAGLLPQPGGLLRESLRPVVDDRPTAQQLQGHVPPAGRGAALPGRRAAG